MKIPWDVLRLIAKKAICETKEEKEKENMIKTLYQTHKKFHTIPEIKNYGKKRLYEYLERKYFYKIDSINYDGIIYTRKIVKSYSFSKNYLRLMFGKCCSLDTSKYDFMIYKDSHGFYRIKLTDYSKKEVKYDVRGLKYDEDKKLFTIF